MSQTGSSANLRARQPVRTYKKEAARGREGGGDCLQDIASLAGLPDLWTELRGELLVVCRLVPAGRLSRVGGHRAALCGSGAVNTFTCGYFVPPGEMLGGSCGPSCPFS